MKYPLIAAALLAASPSFASTRVVAVRRGVETNVGGYALYYRSSCQSAGVADVRVAHQPSHGVVRLARQLARAGRNAGCAGTPVNSLAFYYRPASGYVGWDEFAIAVPSPGNGTHPGVYDTLVYRVRVH